MRTYDFEAGESGWQTTGKSSWSGRNSRRFVHTLVVHNEAIYHATPTNIVAHGTDGRFRWTASADWDTPRGGAAPLTTAPIAAGGLILGCLHDGVYAIDPQTGSRAWKLPMEYQHTGTPAASNGIAYFTRSEGYVHAVDAAAGEVVWKTYLGPASAPLFNNYTSMRVSAPTVFGDAVYVTGSVP